MRSPTRATSTSARCSSGAPRSWRSFTPAAQRSFLRNSQPGNGADGTRIRGNQNSGSEPKLFLRDAEPGDRADGKKGPEELQRRNGVAEEDPGEEQQSDGLEVERG